MTQVCLVCMPFAAIERPSLALGLLQALLEEAGISCRSLYPNLEWARRVGPDRCGFWEDTFGDLVFSSAAFPEHRPPSLPFLAHRAHARKARARLLDLPEDLGGLLREGARLQQEATRFAGEVASLALDTGATLFGCTSMYWQQTASLAVLREIRRRSPQAITLLGGINCEGVMGQAAHRLFPWVDFVVSGEPDDFFASWCRDLLEHGRDLEILPEGVFGPVHRVRGYPAERAGAVPRALCRDLEALPTPQYRDYFAALEDSGLGSVVRPGLPVETARGCWWGQSHQCRFCGISPEGLRFHSKSEARVLRELGDLEERHRLSDFEFTDNILDMRYFRSLLPELAALRPPRSLGQGGSGQTSNRGRRIFWEIKANLKRRQVALLAEAGITWVQPGIEALDSRLLRLLNKGVQAAQNVLLLKWCREQGLAVSWNLLWGAPGEEDSWHAETAGLVSKLVHLQPPRGLVRLRFDRYSPYHSRPQDFGIRLRPARFLSLVYGLPEKDLEDLAYFFEQAEPVPTPAGPGLRNLAAATRRWQQRYWGALRPILTLEEDGEALRVLDSREEGSVRTMRLEGSLREAYLRAEEGSSRAAAGTDESVRELLRLGLLLEFEDRLVGLAVRGPSPPTPTLKDFPGGHLDHAALRRFRGSGSPEMTHHGLPRTQVRPTGKGTLPVETGRST
jgi:ribosomal peptide maturation radical SAM protein 1